MSLRSGTISAPPLRPELERRAHGVFKENAGAAHLHFRPPLHHHDSGAVSYTHLNTTDLSGLATRVRTLELKYDTNVTGNSWSVAFTSLSGVVVTGVWNESQGRIEF